MTQDTMTPNNGWTYKPLPPAVIIRQVNKRYYTQCPDCNEVHYHRSLSHANDYGWFPCRNCQVGKDAYYNDLPYRVAQNFIRQRMASGADKNQIDKLAKQAWRKFKGIDKPMLTRSRINEINATREANAKAKQALEDEL